VAIRASDQPHRHGNRGGDHCDTEQDPPPHARRLVAPGTLTPRSCALSGRSPPGF
jgi:hypothetical protein